MKRLQSRIIYLLLSILALNFVACNDADTDEEQLVIEGEDLRQYDHHVFTLQEHTKGRGINIVLLGDGFTAKDIANGRYEEVMRKASELLFDIEPMRSLRSYFNVYYVTAVSISSALDGQSAMGCDVSDYIINGIPDGASMAQKAKEIASFAPGFDVNNTIVSTVVNSYGYGGVTYYPFHAGETGEDAYNQEIGYAFTAFHEGGIDGSKFRNVLIHETIGHAFAKLSDEYTYTTSEYASPSGDLRRREQSFWWPRYWHLNITGYKNIELPWTVFMDDPDYADENLGVYQGANYYRNGFWRSTENSIMRDTDPEDIGFNVISRWAIYLRTMMIGEGFNPDVPGALDELRARFKTFDLASRGGA